MIKTIPMLKKISIPLIYLLFTVFPVTSAFAGSPHSNKKNPANGHFKGTFSVTNFDWNSLTTQSPTTYNAHSGTTVINGKKFTNLNAGVQGGTCIRIGPTAGTGTIIIKNCYFGASIGEAIDIENFTGSIIIDSCLFANNKSGVYALTSSGITVRNCQFINPHGARSARGQALQFNDVAGPGMLFRKNKGESFRGEGYTEDWVSMHQSSGESCNPIRIDSNMFRGGGPSPSGGGIMTGDAGGSHVVVCDNKLLNVGNYIYACAGGSNIIIINNQGYNEEEDWTNVGVYAYGNCDNVLVINNNVYNYSGIYEGVNHYYMPTPPEEEACDCSIYTGNTSSLSIEDMSFPTQLINYVTEDILWQIRDESVQFRVESVVGEFPASLHRPTSNAGSDQSISVTSVSLSGSGSSSSNGYNYKWVQVSGPNTGSIASPTSSGTNVTGLTNGVYIFRLVVTDDDGAADADWVTVTVSLIV